MLPPSPEVTTLLELAQDPANQRAREDLYHLIEAELRRIARARGAQQPQVPFLTTTELIHEAWVRLMGQAAPNDEPRWKSRRHFFATASRVIQNLLVDHYRKLVKGPRLLEQNHLQSFPARGGTQPSEELERAERFLALHEALQRLDQSDPNAAEICRLRCFGNLLHLLFDQGQPPEGMAPGSQGLSLQQLADYLGLPVSTVHSRWKRAVLFLNRQLQGFAPEGSSEEVGP